MSHADGRALVPVLGFAGLISAADNWIVAPILPSIANGLHVSIAQAAWTLTAYLIPYGIMQPVHGYLSQRWGKAWLLRRLLAGLALGTVGCGVARQLMWLCVCRFVTGFFAAGLVAVSLALIGDRVEPRWQQSCVGRFMGIVFLGQGLSVGCGGVLIQFVGWRVIFVLFSIAALAAIVLLRRLPEDPTARAQSGGFVSNVRLAFGAPLGRRVYLLAFLAGASLLGIYSFIGSFLQRQAGLGPAQAGLVVMFFGLACLAGGACAGRISAAWGAQRTVLTGAVLGACSALLLACRADWRAGLLATLALGCGYILIQSTLATLAFDCGSTGLSSALVGLGLFGGAGLSTALGGALLACATYHTLWLAYAGANTAFVVLITTLRIGRSACPERHRWPGGY